MQKFATPAADAAAPVPDLSTVTAGSTVTVAGTVALFYDVADDGLIRASNLMLDGQISGHGTLEVLAGGSVTVATLSPLGGLTMLVDSNATLSLLGLAGNNAADSVVLTGSNDVLTITAFYANPFVSTISGFDPTTTLLVAGASFDRAVYTQGSAAGVGVLTLWQGSFPSTQINLLGDY